MNDLLIILIVACLWTAGGLWVLSWFYSGATPEREGWESASDDDWVGLSD